MLSALLTTWAASRLATPSNAAQKAASQICKDHLWTRRRFVYSMQVVCSFPKHPYLPVARHRAIFPFGMPLLPPWSRLAGEKGQQAKKGMTGTFVSILRYQWHGTPCQHKKENNQELWSWVLYLLFRVATIIMDPSHCTAVLYDIVDAYMWL